MHRASSTVGPAAVNRLFPAFHHGTCKVLGGVTCVQLDSALKDVTRIINLARAFISFPQHFKNWQSKHQFFLLTLSVRHTSFSAKWVLFLFMFWQGTSLANWADRKLSFQRSFSSELMHSLYNLAFIPKAFLSLSNAFIFMLSFLESVLIFS